jgi:hypothetical protein
MVGVPLGVAAAEGCLVHGLGWVLYRAGHLAVFHSWIGLVLLIVSVAIFVRRSFR